MQLSELWQLQEEKVTPFEKIAAVLWHTYTLHTEAPLREALKNIFLGIFPK